MTETAIVSESASTLLEMLRWRRPAFTKTERLWIDKVLGPLGCERDGFGNIIKRIGDKPRVLYSCHTDTVHIQGGKQEIVCVAGIIKLAPHEKISNCLGADDTTGVWLMREMILAKRPGLYVFHRQEESGAQGAHWIVKNNRHLLDNIDMAIAFDRRGKKSVISHQCSGRTASDVFCEAFSAYLGNDYAPDPTGMFTDTDVYSEHIPECTNISVGYENCHTPSETQSLPFAMWLRGKMLEFDPTALPVKRDPSIYEGWDNDYYRYGRDYRYANDEWEEPVRSVPRPKIFDYTKGQESNQDGMVRLIRQYPDMIADLLEREGYDTDMLADQIFEIYGGRAARAF